MFDQLFSRPWTVARHVNAPFAEERVLYLENCQRRGDTRATLLLKAHELLWIARKLQKYPDPDISMSQLRGLAGHWRDRETAYGRKLNRRWTRRRFIDVARAWLRYLGHLRKTEEPICFQTRVDEYCLWAEHECGLTRKTRELFRRNIEQFLRWYGVMVISGVRGDRQDGVSC